MNSTYEWVEVKKRVCSICGEKTRGMKYCLSCARAVDSEEARIVKRLRGEARKQAIEVVRKRVEESRR